jgi:glycosyltransferase involved in cell wall biosynthesis
MPTYNDEEYIDKAINSLLNQSYKDWELIVIDGSNDKTPEIVKQFADKDNRIKYLREQGSGQLNALLYGSQFVRGEFVTLLHSDDELTDSNAFKRNVSILAENSCDGVFCDLIGMNENGEYSGIVKAAKKIDTSSLAILFLRGGSNIIPDFFFVRKEAFSNVLSSYITWGIQYWLKFEDASINTLNLKKVVPWYKYRVYPGNYGYSEVGKFELATGGLRTILEIGTRMNFPCLKLQRLLLRALKTQMTPLFKLGPSPLKHLQDMVMYVIKSRYKNIPKNLYFNGITGFYSNFPSNRTIRLNIGENEIFVGKDTYLFFRLMEKNMLPPIYENVLEEATHGFGKILVKDKMDYERTKNMMRFLNLLTDVEIE